VRVCIGQINTTPGDFDGNLVRIKKGIEAADAAQCDAIIFPELTIPGYLSQDLIYDSRYIDQNLQTLHAVCDYSNGRPQLHIVVGHVARNEATGKPFFNQAAVIVNGEIVARYRKQLLPFYDVFDELRYFEPGSELTILEIAGKKVGITICEDLWNDKGSDDYNYAGNPLEMYREQGVDVIFSLNSSPYVHGKAWQRIKVIAPGSEPGISVVYVNQYGGQDELVFDGQSFVVKGGDLLYLTQVVAHDTFDVVDLDSSEVLITDVSREDNLDTIQSRSVGLYDLLVLCLRDYVQKSGFKQLVLASSGGVDSAVVCKIACDAVGATNVHAIRMPSIFSSPHSRDDALQLHKNLGCWDYEVPVEHESVVELLNRHFAVHEDEDNLVYQRLSSNDYGSVADENIQARLRDLYVMHFSNAYGAMPLSTGNKTESACGYYTHFDMNFSFAPIKDLYKFQVMDIAREQREIPENIWKKPPSAELAEGQSDEASLLPYAILDAIVHAYVEDYVSTFPGFTDWLQQQLSIGHTVSGDHDYLLEWTHGLTAEADFLRILSLIGRMEYKRRQTCPGTKVSKVAFGIGRRIPIVERWS
jgi:NAD+ synthase (glutamine-hydrolysing)|tara:strand:- start:24 stop:1781 length:1758 start_codon:yes stop_codon:yes gene_type:complete